jgi:hypothetical protein
MTNTPGIPPLTDQERAYVDAALELLKYLKKTFEFWMTIAQALKALRDRADAIGGKFTFDRLREREGLGPEIINKTRVSRLLAILERRDEVERWRATLASNKRFDWQSPESIWNKCPIFHEPKEDDPKTEPKPSPMAKLKLANQDLQEENFQLNERLKRADGAALFSLAVDEIMEILTSSMDQAKGKDLAARLSEFYSQKGQRGATKPKTGAERTRRWREKKAGEQAAQEG